MACQRYTQGLLPTSSDSNDYQPDVEKRGMDITIMELCTNFNIFQKLESSDYFAIETFHQ